jgi:hypothetical protein
MEEHKMSNVSSDYYDYGKYCDESKCVSSLLTGRRPDDSLLWLQGLGSLGDATFVCYAQGYEQDPIFPFVCADGYEGHAIKNQPPIVVSGKNLSYYTCCPPHLYTPSTATSIGSNTNNSSSNSTSTSLTTTPVLERHCSDPKTWPTVVESNISPSLQETNNSLCDINDIQNRTYVRNMTKDVGHENTYMCCNSLLLDDDKDNGDDTDIDCVPYGCSDIGYNCISNNEYGRMEMMSCSNDVYKYPKEVTFDWNRSHIRFDCCKTGDQTLLLPTSTKAFQETIWLQLIVSLIAFCFSFTLMVSLLLPLILKIKCYCTKSDGDDNVYHQQRRQRRKRKKNNGLEYSSYNLYLVFLAVPDVLVSINFILICGSMISGQSVHLQWAMLDWIETNYIPWITFGGQINYACFTASMFMNVVLAYEVYMLLLNSHRSRPHAPPSFLKVTIQSLVAYIAAIVMAGVNYYFLLLGFTDYTKWFIISPIFYAVSAAIPFLILICFCTLIWTKRVVRSTDKHLRVLSVFFLRILLVFLITYIPAFVLVTLSYTASYTTNDTIDGPQYASACLLYLLQPILSSTMSFLKPDVWAMVKGTLTCSVFCNNNNNNNNNDNDDNDDNARGGEDKTKLKFWNQINKIKSVVKKLFQGSTEEEEEEASSSSSPTPSPTLQQQQNTIDEESIFSTKENHEIISVRDDDIPSDHNNNNRLDRTYPLDGTNNSD